MRYAVVLTKTIVVHVDAKNITEACDKAVSEGNEAAVADGSWEGAEPQIQHVEPA